MIIQKYRPVRGKTNLPTPRDLRAFRERPVRQEQRHINPREAGSTTGEVMGFIVCGAVGTTVGVMGFSTVHYIAKGAEEIPGYDCMLFPSEYRSHCGGHYHINYDKEVVKSLINPAFAYEHVLQLAVETPFSGLYVMGGLALLGYCATATFLLYLLGESISEKIGSSAGKR